MVIKCDEQLSGVAELNIFLIEETSNWPIVLNDTNAAQIIFTPEQNSVDALIKPDSIVISHNKPLKNSGILHTINIKMDFLNRSEALEQLLEQYENKACVVLAKFNNKFRKIYGSNIQPLYFIYEDNPGRKIDDDASTSIEIKGETTKRPVFYTVV